jgi:hypothetical protein
MSDSDCQHEHTEVFEYDRTWQGEAGIEYEVMSYTYCLDCGAEIETPTCDVLAIDSEPTLYELENNLMFA